MNVQTNTMTCLTLLDISLLDTTLPADMPSPFQIPPHPIASMAAHELMHNLSHNLIHSTYDFGLSQDSTSVGKMMGVLVVEDLSTQSIGYLSAFSGRLGDTYDVLPFVPPICNILEEHGFFRQGETLISQINIDIERLTEDIERTDILQQIKKTDQSYKHALAELKIKLKQNKANRAAIRQQLRIDTSTHEKNILHNLSNESQKDHYLLKDLKKTYHNKIADLKAQLDVLETRIQVLKAQRKAMSNQLQERLFEEYTFVDLDKNYHTLKDIFNLDIGQSPPSGAGECCAPKLLQYAIENNLRPLAMAEFWWGKSPDSELRRHQHFYPPCRSKCLPILTKMLKKDFRKEADRLRKMDIDITLPIIYEDDSIIVLDKPSGLLTVPGKSNQISVFSLIRKKYPRISGPIIVHRLDMDTSGLLLVAKSKDIFVNLQKQFLHHKIKKKYIALLDGKISQSYGEISLPIRVDLEDRPRQMVCYQYGKEAHTHWEKINDINGQTLVAFYPTTGRTHQLRIHAAHIHGLNTPIVGDDLYGTPSQRLHLHASSLGFFHPVHNGWMVFDAECPFYPKM